MLTIVSVAAIALLAASVFQLRAMKRGSRKPWPRVVWLIAAWASVLWLVFMLAMFVIAVREGV